MSRDEQLEDVTDREHVRIDHDRAALVTHQLGRHEAQGRERLQVVVAPVALDAVPQIRLTFVLEEETVILVIDDPNVERVAVLGVAFHRVRRDQGAEILTMIGMNEDAGLHRDISPAHCLRPAS